MSEKTKVTCRSCGACCIALSISSRVPGYSGGKPAGERCVHLNEENLCGIYEERPAVCREFSPSSELCGNSLEEALMNLSELEELTRP